MPQNCVDLSGIKLQQISAHHSDHDLREVISCETPNCRIPIACGYWLAN